jgi:hypothetical protein
VSINCGVTDPSGSARPSQVADLTNRLGNSIVLMQLLANNLLIVILPIKFQTIKPKPYLILSCIGGDRFDPPKKARRRQEIFSQDCDKALATGARFARK